MLQMALNTRKRLGDLLLESSVITQEQLEYSLANKSRDEKLGDFLIKEGLLTEQQLIEVLEFQLGVPHIQLNQYTIDNDLTNLVSGEMAKRLNIMPIRRERNKLFIAMADPMDYFAIEEVRMATGCQIETSIAAKDDLFRTITKYYDLQESMEAALNDIGEDAINETQNEILDEDSPIVRLVNQIIASAVSQRASDIHFDAHETEFRVRYRIDGVLHNQRSLPKNMQNVITARVKIMGALNITENRIPQDGRIKLTVNFKPIDIRLSTLPTVFGEKIVMRILDLSNTTNDIDKLGFTDVNKVLFEKMIARPNGIVLITGPTGSGKSTTLYAALHNLNSEGVNIITVEDPVEYQLDGINQIQVKEEVGLTFATGLRSILRQDPDIVMIGEIRDSETGHIAVRASLTGHLVLSTLHTNSAVESISRLDDMGVEPYLLSSSLIGIMAQRLVRRVCRDCGQTEELSPHEQQMMAEHGHTVTHIKRGKGCTSCNNTGYRGRLAIHEILPIDRDLKEMILARSSAAELRDYMSKAGYKSLLEDGLIKVAQGYTTLEEVIRVANAE